MKYLRPYNESIDYSQAGASYNTKMKEFKEALEIYAEELPFTVDNLGVKYDTPKLKKSNTTNVYWVHTGGKGTYTISYDHIDDSLKSLVPTEDTDDAEMFDLTGVNNKVEADVKLYFTKFAKKYDLDYSRCIISIHLEEDENDIFSTNLDVITEVTVKLTDRE